jgi:pantetheine hydrolase
MNVTEHPEIATFETDFGVTFGHFICFDILFKSPALDLIDKNVTHFLYPSMWFSETPFLTSIQTQQSFAQRNNIVLLSAGTNSPLSANTGSGIFVGAHGAVDKIISWKNETRMLIAEVPKDVNDPDYEPMEPPHEPYPAANMTRLKLWNFTPKPTHQLTHHKVIEIQNGLCKFNLSYSSQEAVKNAGAFGYRLAAFSGTKDYSGVINAGEIYCAVIPCADSHDEETCGRINSDSLPSITFHRIDITLELHDEAKNYLIMPTSLDTSILPLSTDLYEFETRDAIEIHSYSIKTSHRLHNLMTFGIFGRNFSLDNKNFKDSTDEDSSDEMPESDDSYETDATDENVDDEVDDLQLKMSIYITLMVVLSIVTSIMVYRKLKTPYIKPDVNRRKPSMREL